MQGCRGQALLHSSRGLAVWLHGRLGQAGGTGAVSAAGGQLWGGQVGAWGCSYSTPSGNATPTDTPTETDTGAPSDTGAPTELVFLLILFPLLIRLLLPKLVLLLVIIAIQFDW